MEFGRVGDWFSTAEESASASENLHEAARRWGRRNGSIRIIELPSVRLQKPNKKVIFANCGRHDHCKARYKFEHTPGSMGSVYPEAA